MPIRLFDDLSILHDHCAEYASGAVDQGGFFREFDGPAHEFFIVVSHKFPFKERGLNPHGHSHRGWGNSRSRLKQALKAVKKDHALCEEIMNRIARL